ncbi:MAG: hypothetical protein IJP66_08990, partial [Kiritimatiellae bacterium]|nr:hypothetical protein [Kiritimatiellia bacterium]
QALLPLLACAAALAGCANYRLGTTLPPNLKTIHVATFENHTAEPNIEQKITTAVLRQFQHDGQLKVVSAEDQADISLTAVLKSYDVDSLLYERGNPSATRRYRARIFCDIDATETATGRTVVKRQVVGDTTFPAAGDTVTARRNALEDVARDLATEVVDAVIGAW